MSAKKGALRTAETAAPSCPPGRVVAPEVVRATAGAQEHIPCIDFVAEAEHCPVCGEAVQAQKSKRRLVVTVQAGTFVAREVRKRCGSDGTHPVLVSAQLSSLVPPRQGYGYDLIVQVGLARYLRNLQREEIRTELLAEQGIVVSDGSISNLCDRFLRLLEGLHRWRAPALRAAMNAGYPLHIDATSEHGKGGLFLCLDGRRGWVLHAVKITSENADELRPCIEETIRRFGDPIAVVRDLSTAEAGAVERLRKKGIPDLLCHYHVLGAIGKKLFDDPQGEAALTKISFRSMELSSILYSARPGGYNCARHPPVRGPAFEPARDCPTTRCGA